MIDCAIVTGAAGGLGRHLALGLARTGYGIVVADTDERAAGECARLVEASGVPARALRADVRDRHDRDRVLAAARELGGPRVLVNNAGGWTPGDQYPHAAESAWTATIELNLIAPMALSQLVIPAMRERGGGAIVNIASSGGIGAEAYGSPEYGAAKAGLIRFTATLGGLGDVRVMCVAPDWIGLDRAQTRWRAMSAAERAASRPLIPPGEVIAAVLDLIRAGAGGQVVEIWGGDPPDRK
ncbi:putative short-chain dehydrogenase [Actinoplanes missouriensis 431]|uniref:Putative short-chain dehydrogenase n=1 Tax=Actinoplanes missouriensis (strain ATCC 14538 / DSM 43046 / CBS 188.64 / JCM 3121 / NBRC 102363 / NCIMB 12654 / NRRL B-3342 / UNCC 431) TaxID=512565 RepID=I0H8X2_ACTM4|nr:SDR family oxidoreductase [Actinoplanes missouriensis]BAL89459.1 putative short-chain dehydrogenase [Actinoplanes missouriensis 431]